jgi:S-ribosylhomocysteine lyase LuxS involved in autoinducer biosynthesis
MSFMTCRDVLKADASVVDLNRLAPNFYQTGLHLVELPTRDSEDIADLLPEVCTYTV